MEPRSRERGDGHQEHQGQVTEHVPEELEAAEGEADEVIADDEDDDLDAEDDNSEDDDED